MRRTDLKTGIALLTAIGTLGTAPLAAAEEEAEAVVPPDNAAVNQYTETFPTARGDRDVNGGKGKQASPNRVLGSRNAQKLEQHGAEGRAVAEVAAETAPSVEREAPVAEKEPEESVGGGAASDNDRDAGGGGNREAKPVLERADRADATQAAVPPGNEVEVPNGSSGLSEVLAQATGSTSSGELGLLLPLVIVAALGWAAAVMLRRPHRTPR